MPQIFLGVGSLAVCCDIPLYLYMIIKACQTRSNLKM
jgi:hypothetical protein